MRKKHYPFQASRIHSDKTLLPQAINLQLVFLGGFPIIIDEIKFPV